MVLPTSVISDTQSSPKKTPGGYIPNKTKNQQQVVGDLIKIIESEYQKGNRTVTQEKYNAFLKLRDLQSSAGEIPKKASPPALPAPLYPPIFSKFRLPERSKVEKKKNRALVNRKNVPWTFKSVESALIAALEAVASVLDNLHLLSKMPMFPKSLAKLLNHTNRIWVLILVFLIRKTISQLLNVGRKERKVASELAILQSNSNSKLLEQASQNDDSNIFRRYEKVLRDLKFDKTMLRIELLGNLLDLAFNVIELYDVPVSRWFMGMLNFASMAMTIYRMNKDDEYIDDDISEELI